jgi:hypothetical protein
MSFERMPLNRENDREMTVKMTEDPQEQHSKIHSDPNRILGKPTKDMQPARSK